MADAQTCLVSKAYEQMMVSGSEIVRDSTSPNFRVRVMYGFIHRGQIVVSRIVLHILFVWVSR